MRAGSAQAISTATLIIYACNGRTGPRPASGQVQTRSGRLRRGVMLGPAATTSNAPRAGGAKSRCSMTVGQNHPRNAYPCRICVFHTEFLTQGRRNRAIAHLPEGSKLHLNHVFRARIPPVRLAAFALSRIRVAQKRRCLSGSAGESRCTGASRRIFVMTKI